jgi:hypothetical protein
MLFPLDFEEWYVGEHVRLYAALLVVTGDPHLAEDATDEALARTLHHWKRVREMDSPGGWTYRVAVNIVRRTARRRAIERRLLPRLAADPVVPAPAGEVWDLVRSLTKRQRMALRVHAARSLRRAAHPRRPPLGLGAPAADACPRHGRLGQRQRGRHARGIHQSAGFGRLRSRPWPAPGRVHRPVRRRATIQGAIHTS